MKHLITTCVLIYAMGISIASLAQPAQPASLRQFTLLCKTQKAPPPPIPSWVIDVNLDLMTYYADTQFGGLDEIMSDDGRWLTFLKWGYDVHGLPTATQDVFDRNDGHWYFSVKPDSAVTPPDAICDMNPPRENFKAHVKFSRLER